MHALVSPRLSRRSFVSLMTGAVAFGGFAVLAACGATAPATGQAAATTAPVTGAQAATTTSAAAASTATASKAAVATTVTAQATSAASSTSASQSNVQVAAAAGGTTVQWWNGYAKPQDLANGLLAKEWSPSHPKLGIELVQHVGNNIKAEEQLTVLLAGGTPPDLCDVPMSENDLGTHGLSQPIDDLVARDKYDLSNFSKAHMELAHVNGKLTAIPYSVGGNGYAMVYNRNMLAQAGIAEPPASWDQAWTWDTFRDNLRRLTKPGAQTTQVGLGDYGYYVLTIPIPFKTDWITPDLKTITCDSPNMITAYSDYLDLVLKDRTTQDSPGVKLDTSGPTGAFGVGQAAISMFGSWQTADYAKLTKVDWAFMPSPKGAVASPEFGPVFLAISQGAKQRDDAWELLKWLVDGGRYAHFIGKPGATKADAQTTFQEQFKDLANVRWQVLLDEYDIAQPLPYIRRHPAWGPMSALTDAAWKDLTQGKQDVPTAFAKLKPALQGIADQWAKSHPSS